MNHQALQIFFRTFVASLRDLLPIVIVVLFFQFVVLQQPLPNVGNILYGLVLVMLGLTFFVFGLEQGLFPLGESTAHAFARSGSAFWLLTFSFALGFGTTIAEPALLAIANKAAGAAAEAGVISNAENTVADYAFALRLTVAVGVGVAIVLGVLRILRGWSLRYMLVVGYLAVLVGTAYAPDSVIGLAFDAGGVTTSTITVPLVAALGVGLASSIKGLNPLCDGFGLIAFATLLPIIFVLCFGLVMQ